MLSKLERMICNQEYLENSELVQLRPRGLSSLIRAGEENSDEKSEQWKTTKLFLTSLGVHKSCCNKYRYV